MRPSLFASIFGLVVVATAATPVLVAQDQNPAKVSNAIAPAWIEVGAIFEESIELVGVSLPESLVPGEQEEMWFRWRILSPVSESIEVFVHVESQQAPLRQRIDHTPVQFSLGGAQVGEEFTYSVPLVLDDRFQFWTPTLYLGLWRRWGDESRLPISDSGAYEAEVTGRLSLGELTVVPFRRDRFEASTVLGAGGVVDHENSYGFQTGQESRYRLQIRGRTLNVFEDLGAGTSNSFYELVVRLVTTGTSEDGATLRLTLESIRFKVVENEEVISRFDSDARGLEPFWLTPLRLILHRPVTFQLSTSGATSGLDLETAVTASGLFEPNVSRTAVLLLADAVHFVVPPPLPDNLATAEAGWAGRSWERRIRGRPFTFSSRLSLRGADSESRTQTLAWRIEFAPQILTLEGSYDHSEQSHGTISLDLSSARVTDARRAEHYRYTTTLHDDDEARLGHVLWTRTVDVQPL